jgi:ribosomal protein L19E
MSCGREAADNGSGRCRFSRAVASFCSKRYLVAFGSILIIPICHNSNTRIEALKERSMGSRRRGSGRRKVGRKKRRMRSKIRHRK